MTTKPRLVIQQVVRLKYGGGLLQRAQHDGITETNAPSYERDHFPNGRCRTTCYLHTKGTP